MAHGGEAERPTELEPGAWEAITTFTEGSTAGAYRNVLDMGVVDDGFAGNSREMTEHGIGQPVMSVRLVRMPGGSGVITGELTHRMIQNPQGPFCGILRLVPRQDEPGWQGTAYEVDTGLGMGVQLQKLP